MEMVGTIITGAIGIAFSVWILFRPMGEEEGK